MDDTFLSRHQQSFCAVIKKAGPRKSWPLLTYEKHLPQKYKKKYQMQVLYYVFEAVSLNMMLITIKKSLRPEGID